MTDPTQPLDDPAPLEDPKIPENAFPKEAPGSTSPSRSKSKSSTPSSAKELKGNFQSIPHPPEKPIVGNILDLDASTQVQDLMGLARKLGPIFYLNLGGRRLVVVSSASLVAELCDEKRFDKRVWAPLQRVRAFAGDGLFTAHTFEPNWKKAHNILLPNFSGEAMRGYHPMMLDVIHQLLDRWARVNPRDEIDVSDSMTRLTLDTIGLCGFDYRFNSFYRERMHPFVRAMTRAMTIALDRSVRPEISNRLLWRQNKRFRRAVGLMNEIVDGIIQERRALGEHQGEALADRRDLLSCMLAGEDRESGERLDDLNIRYQIITFLIAGHETTSGLLSFATYYMMKHPQVMAKATEEVDRVLGSDLGIDPTFRQVAELRYVRQVLDEALRLWPTAPMFSLFPKEGETTLGNTYRVSQRDALAVLTPMLHRDSSVWGDDAEVFDPDRFSPERSKGRPVHAFKPFGNGQRACIGRQFAQHEATLAMAMILQRFRLIEPHGYQLDIKETLTLKPQGFRIQVEPREHLRRDALLRISRGAPEGELGMRAPASLLPSGSTAATTGPVPSESAPTHGTPLLVLYGSNMGTAEGVARRMAEQARAQGFAVELAPLDSHAGDLPTEGAVLIATASYNGTPPDNAQRFCDWLDQAEGKSLEGVQFTVFGCGHRDWTATYQAVPKKIDQRLEELGAERIFRRGEGDGSLDFDGDFEGWYEPLWPALAETFELDLVAAEEQLVPFTVEVLDQTPPSPILLSSGAQPMVVVENRELQGRRSGRSTRHIELALPAGVEYQTGDHLGVVAQNDEAQVRRVCERFGFDSHTRVQLGRAPGAHTQLPLGQTIRVGRLLSDLVELNEPANRHEIETLAEHTECPPDREELLALANDADKYRREILDRRVSLIDLLERFPACQTPFGVYLALLPPIRPRYYSISSSPRRFASICSLTVAVVEGPARSGQGAFRGLASGFLAGKEKGSTVNAFVRDTRSPFRPPEDPATPMIMIGPGTGVAPFRGFLQDRAALAEKGKKVGASMLFFGCRHPEHDFLYQDELEGYQEEGLVELVTAFSRQDPEHKIYVQHQLLDHGDSVWKLLEAGAAVYVCGDASAMAPAVRQSFAELYRQQTGKDAGAAEEWLSDLDAGGRYLVDVWASV